MVHCAIVQIGDRSILLNQILLRLIDDIQPGDRLDLDDIPPEQKEAFMDEFDGQGFILSSGGIIGIVEKCSVCDGSAEFFGGACPRCEGYSWLQSFGEGWSPYRE